MSFLTNLRQKEFMRCLPWFFGCCVLWGISLTLDPAGFLIFNTDLDYNFWNSPVLRATIFCCLGFVYLGAVSKFSYQNVVFYFAIFYGLLCLNFLLHDFFPVKPEPAMVALIHVFNVAWRGVIPILIFTGVNRFLNVRMGMRIYPILILLMTVGTNLGSACFLILRMYSDSHPAEFKWPGIIAIFAMAFLLRKFSGLPATQKRGISHPYLAFPHFVFGILVLVLAFSRILSTVWQWCTSWAIHKNMPKMTGTFDQIGELYAYGAWTALVALSVLLALTLWIAYRKRWEMLLWTWAGLLGAISLILMFSPPASSEIISKPVLIGMNLASIIPTSILFIALKEPIYLAFSVDMRTKFKPFCDSIATSLAAIWASLWNTWTVFLEANPVIMASALTICVVLFSFWSLKIIGKHLKLEDYS